MNPAIRFPVASIGALMLCAALFTVLQMLVSQPLTLMPVTPPRVIDFTPHIEDTTPEEIRQKPVLPKPLVVPPIVGFEAAPTDNPAPPITLPPIVTIGPIGPSIQFGPSNDAIPLVRINPEYPRSAAARGTEGWVQLEFVITPAGTVDGARVIDAEPRGTFDDAALKAIARWKYNPKVVDGRPVERHGVQVVLRFQLEGNGG